jgi:uncharacterized membrane protein YhaH (DUF805 family)
MHSYAQAWKRAGELKGRSSRKEYWTFWLANALIIFGIEFLFAGMGAESTTIKVISLISALIVFLPTLSCGVRRLHDIGQSGWVVLIALFPLLGIVILLILEALPGEKGPNKYGQDPKDSKKDLPTPGPVETVSKPVLSAETAAPTTVQNVTISPPANLSGTAAAEPAIVGAAEEPMQQKADLSWLIPLGFILGMVLIVVLGVTLSDSPSRATFVAPPASKTTSDANPFSKILVPCPSGLPPGVEIGEISDPSEVQGANGKLSFSLGKGDRWDSAFDFTASNDTKDIPGYCITAIEVQLALRSPDGTIRKVTKRDTIDQTQLGPGGSSQLRVNNVTSTKDANDIELSSWKITRVWGFRLNQ